MHPGARPTRPPSLISSSCARERPPAHFLDRLQAEVGFDPPRQNGFDTVEAIRALRDGRARVFIGLGGNFVQAAPDTDVTAAALRSARLTVQISTKINRSHLTCGETALILPTLGRTEQDMQASGPQFVSVETPPARCTRREGRFRQLARCSAPRSPSSPEWPRRHWVAASGSTGRACATITGGSAPTSPGSYQGARAMR